MAGAYHQGCQNPRQSQSLPSCVDLLWNEQGLHGGDLHGGHLVRPPSKGHTVGFDGLAGEVEEGTVACYKHFPESHCVIGMNFYEHKEAQVEDEWMNYHLPHDPPCQASSKTPFHRLGDQRDSLYMPALVDEWG